MTIKEILIYLACKYEGDWASIYKAVAHKELVDEEEVMKVNSKLGCNALILLEPDYPESLKHCYHPPFVIFYKGDISLLNRDIVSVVGSRDVDDYGIEMTKKIVSELKNKDVVVCSGLAKGVDKAAHEEALKNDIKTIAVLPTGIENCYPKENYYLYKEIEEKGLIISEYPFDTKIEKKMFSTRNRIIASLCKALVVTAVKQRSGTMVSVRYALEYGKDVYVVPYPATSDSFANTLIKEGALLITEGNDIFEKF